MTLRKTIIVTAASFMAVPLCTFKILPMFNYMFLSNIGIKWSSLAYIQRV